MPWSARAAPARHAGQVPPAAARGQRSPTRRSSSRSPTAAPARLPTFDIPGMPGAQMGMLNLGDIFGKAFGERTKRKRMTVGDSYPLLMEEESDKLLDQEQVKREALHAVEQNGIVFIDEIDKISGREHRGGADVSREGVQRDLLPLIEGTSVTTKHGAMRTEHILFIASRRLPQQQAVRPAARAAGPAADPGRAPSADPSRSRAHPGRARGEPGQAVRRAAGDRGRDPRVHRRRGRRDRAGWRPRSTKGSRTSAPAGCIP